MKFYIDRKQVKVLKRKAKSIVLKVINTFRYSTPGPIGVSTVANLAKDDTVQLLWRGEAPPSQYFNHYHPPNFLNLSHLTFKEPFVALLKNGRIYGERGYVITNTGYILTDVNPEMSQSRDRHSLVDRGLMPTYKKIKGTVAVLNSAGYNNYFHYLFDTLGRLQYFEQEANIIDYYYTPHNTRFQRELLDLFEIPQNKIIQAQKDKHLMADRLLVTSVPGDTTLANKRYKPYKDLPTYQFISKKIIDKLPTSIKKENTQLLYIQRRGNRAIENEAPLLERLSNIGTWHIARLEEHSVTEQVNLFRNAKVIVTLHGAGLANLIFCKPQTTVIEITNPAYPSPLYYQMASLLKLKYIPIIGDIKDSVIGTKNDIRSNVKVDIELVVRAAQQALEDGSTTKSQASNTVADE